MAEPFWQSDEIVEPKAPAPANNYFWSQDEIVQPKGEKPSTASDVVNSLGSGILKGAISLVGLPGDAAGGIGWLADTLAEKITGQPLPEKFKANEPVQSVGSARLRKDFEQITGSPLYEPQTTAGKYASTVGEFIPAAGGGVANSFRYAVLPGLASEAAGQATKGSAIEPFARIGAGLAASALPSLARRAVTPLPISPERQAMANTLAAEGVPITAGQRTGNESLQYAESILGAAPGAGNQARAAQAAQADAFTEAAMRRVGGQGLATPENMADNYNRITQNFRDLSARNTLQADAQLGQDLGNVLREYDRVLTPDRRRVIGDLATDIVQRFQVGQGTMPGRDYQTIRSRLTKRAQGAGTDDDYRNAARGLRNALDNAMERSIIPEDAGAWAETRRQYGNWKDVAKAAGGAGENAAHGRVSPQAMRSAVASGRNREAYVRGEGDFADLVRAGNALMTPLPNSGTAQRTMVVGSGGGAAGALATGNLPLAAALAAGPGVAGRLLHSGPVQAYLGNQLLQPLPAGPVGDSLVRMLLTGRQALLAD